MQGTPRDPLGSDDQAAGRDRCPETEPQPNSNNIHDPQQRRNMAHSQVTEIEMLTRSVKNLTENISGPAAESVALVMASMDPSEAELSAPASEQAPLKGGLCRCQPSDRSRESFGYWDGYLPSVEANDLCCRGLEIDNFDVKNDLQISSLPIFRQATRQARYRGRAANEFGCRLSSILSHPGRT